MHAMILEKPATALQHHEVSAPSPGIGQVKVRVLACAVCRTDLHVVDGELPQPKLPLIPGHEIVGEIVECGPQTEFLRSGTRVGIPWLAWTCGSGRYCQLNRQTSRQNSKFPRHSISRGLRSIHQAQAAFCFSL